VQPFYDGGDRFANARDFAQPILCDDPVERLAQREQIVGRAGVGVGFERIVAEQRGALTELAKELGDGGCIQGGHDSAPMQFICISTRQVGIPPYPARERVFTPR
jgi:hypothetical protein